LTASDHGIQSLVAPIVAAQLWGRGGASERGCVLRPGERIRSLDRFRWLPWLGHC
jgi:hypothetical protein